MHKKDAIREAQVHFLVCESRLQAPFLKKHPGASRHLVLPLTTTNTKLVLFFSTFECRHFAHVPGALHARESSHEKQ